MLPCTNPNPPKFTVLIPARLESTRLPNKPLLNIGGEPMIIRVAKQAKKSHAKQIIVATDSDQIESICKKFDITVCRTSKNHKNGTERIAEATRILNFSDHEIVVNVQGDEPFIDPDLITSVADKLHKDTSCNMATAACNFTYIEDLLSPHTVKVILNKLGFANYFSRAPIPYSLNKQLAKHIFTGQKTNLNPNARLTYHQHIGIYAYRVNFLHEYVSLETAPTEQFESLEQLRALWHGEKIPVFLNKIPSIGGIDTQEDYERAQDWYIQRLYKNRL